MADEAIASFGERFEMVLEDLAALTAERVIADGFGLLPELVAPLIADPRQAIYLLPTPTFREWALRQRGWITIEGTSDPGRARSNRLARDALLTEHVRQRAVACGITVIDVGGTPPLEKVTAVVEQHFGLA
jgi:hypothetical protein